MPKSGVTWEGRRALTDNPNTGAGAFKQAARELMDKDLLADAATFFALAGDAGALAAITARAAEEGDFFLFQAASKHAPEPVTRAQLETLRAAAEKHGKALYAERAAHLIETL